MERYTAVFVPPNTVRMKSHPGSSTRRILNSWKEISSYLGRGVRTVQRWEVFYGLPVHRPSGHSRAAVVAFTDELDSWMRKSSAVKNGDECHAIAIEFVQALRRSKPDSDAAEHLCRSVLAFFSSDKDPAREDDSLATEQSAGGKAIPQPSNS
jgi:hypothetical protein